MNHQSLSFLPYSAAETAAEVAAGRTGHLRTSGTDPRQCVFQPRPLPNLAGTHREAQPVARNFAVAQVSARQAREEEGRIAPTTLPAYLDRTTPPMTSIQSRSASNPAVPECLARAETALVICGLPASPLLAYADSQRVSQERRSGFGRGGAAMETQLVLDQAQAKTAAIPAPPARDDRRDDARNVRARRRIRRAPRRAIR